jgi:hypothetical protein
MVELIDLDAFNSYLRPPSSGRDASLLKSGSDFQVWDVVTEKVNISDDGWNNFIYHLIEDKTSDPDSKSWWYDPPSDVVASNALESTDLTSPILEDILKHYLIQSAFASPRRRLIAWGFGSNYILAPWRRLI